MSKKNKTPLGIFIESIGLYFSNFNKFFKYMSFPVCGQVIGLAWIFTLTYFYIKNMPNLLMKFPVVDNFSILFGVLFLLILPGLILFLKSFWDYLVAYGAINSMLENLLKSGKVYDFDAHTELIKRRAVSFVGLWSLMGVFTLISIFPLFWVPCCVIGVFIVLIFQVFTFEPELSPIGCIKKSFSLIKGHFASTLMLLFLVGALTYIFIPQLLVKFLNYTNLTLFFSSLVLPLAKELPITEWNTLLSYVYIPPLNPEILATFLTTSLISQMLIQYTLPIRTILWGMWYKELNGGKLYISKEDRPKKCSSKKASEKLMEASKRKYSSKKLDKNILKRAMEKDE